MKEVSISTIYGYVAPYAAPVPSAYVLGVNVYHSILTVTGQEYWWLAAIAAFIGMVGIESTGGLSAILVSRAFVQKSWSIMWMAMLAVVAYAAFVAWGIYTSDDSRPMITTVAITLLAYFVVALWEGMKTLDKQNATETSTALLNAQARAQELDAEVKRLEAQRKLTNSEIRLAKASNPSSASNGQRPVSNGRTGQDGQYDMDTLDKVMDILRQDPKASTRKIVDAGIGIRSPQTALKYRSKAFELLAQNSSQDAQA